MTLQLPRLTFRRLRATPVLVRMNYVLGTSAAALRHAPLLLVDLDTHEGVTGHSYQFCYNAAAAPGIVSFLGDINDALSGAVLVPAQLWATLSKRYTLVGVEGVVRMAMAVVDIAAWDALANAAALPLYRFLGATSREIRAYNSNGLGLMPSERLADEAEQLLAGGFAAVKLRLGYPTVDADLAAVRAVRQRLPATVDIMVDYNQALTMREALQRAAALDDEGLYWIEEPIRHNDYSGCAAIAARAKTPVQIGENFSQVQAMRVALDANACDYVMPDPERIGGVSGWLQASALAAEVKIPMSSHLYPEVAVHLLAATPTAHWLEYVDWMNPLLVHPLPIVGGVAVPPERPGLGLAWNTDAVRKYAVP